MRSRSAAFAHIDALALICCLAVLLALILVAGRRGRDAAMQSGSIANLHQFASITSSYHADNNGRFWSLNWSPTEFTVSQYPDLRAPYFGSQDATACHAADILRRRGGPIGALIPRISQWAVSVQYSHLVLADYLDTSALLRFAVSPGDRKLQQWSHDPAGFHAYAYPPQPDGFDPVFLRYPFSSSYRVPPAFWSPDFVTAARGTFLPSTTHNTFVYQPPAFDIGRRTLSEVRYPSHKVHMFDSAQWQGARSPIYWGYDFARVPMVFVDGSAHVRASRQSNPGFNPSTPTSLFPLVTTYAPQAWEPPVINNLTNLTGRYYWTRNGLGGRDYDGLEVPAVP